VEKIGKALEPVKQPMKVYPIDLGFLNISPRKNSFSSRLETVVAIELYRRYGNNIYYWKNHQGREVDFVVTDGVTVRKLVQVTYEIRHNDEKQYRREINSLLEASRQLKCRELEVVT